MVADRWPGRLAVLAFVACYVTGMWGQAARLLPAPLSDWHDLPYRLAGAWWQAQVPVALGREVQLALFQTLAAYVLGLLVPVLALRAAGVDGAAAGLARPAGAGGRITLLGVLVTLPVGFWLVAITPDPWGSPLYELLGYLVMVPEHFLVFGVLGALLAPGRRLGWTPGPVGWFTLIGAALLFGLLHVGTPRAAELWSAFPLGAVFAAITLVTASIWPALIAHATLNLAPLIWWAWPG